MWRGPMVMVDFYNNLFSLLLIFVVLLFSCLVVMLFRQREMVQILKEIRDKK